MTTEELIQRVKRLHAEDKVPSRLTDEERKGWAYGNTRIENRDITRDIIDSAFACLQKSR